MIEHTNDTTPATPSQHPRTDEGACEREVETLRRLLDDSTQVRNLVLAELEAEQAAHVLDVQIFESGAREMAAMLDSTRARITEIVDAVKAEREAERGWGTSLTAWQDAKALTDAMVRKHEGAGVSEAISVEALEREGWHDIGGAIYRKTGTAVQVVFHSTRIDVIAVSSVVPNCHTIRDLNTLVRLFTAPDEAGTR